MSWWTRTSSRPHLSVDLGTAYVRIGVPGEPVVVERPTASDDAPGAAMRSGVIDDLDAAAATLAGTLREASLTNVRRARVVVSVPATSTGVERRAVSWVAEMIGIRTDILLVDEPIAAAIGLGLDIADDRPLLIVDVGHGITEAAVIASGDIVAVRAVRLGCSELDDPAARPWALTRIVGCVGAVLDDLSPEVAAEVDQVHLVGGGSLRSDVTRRLLAATGLPISLDGDRLHAVARGDAVCAAGSFAPATIRTRG
jgi:rod shape-determining protein MreB and related proteins